MRKGIFFACVDVSPKNKRLFVYLKLNPNEEEIVEGFTRDMRNIGHWGTGDFEVIINNLNDFEKAKPLIQEVMKIVKRSLKYSPWIQIAKLKQFSYFSMSLFPSLSNS